ncbi:MAG: hypothetical protein K2X67_04090 [Burkholderiales bacterium]|jgi:hypothetical protein|nr:hypothetical protein [Burkholderiales bacterium]
MTPQQLVGIAVRLFALWLAIKSIGYWAAIPISLEANMIEGSTALSFVIGGIYLVSALLLWFFPLWIAHRLIPRTNFDNRLSANAFDLARVGCSILGLWLLSRALPAIVWFFFRSFLVGGSTSLMSSLTIDDKVDFAVSVFELALGVLLLARAGTFAGWMVRERDVEQA